MRICVQGEQGKEPAKGLTAAQLKDMGKSFDLIILDVGSTGDEGHCTAPPEEFLREENMKNFHEILEDGGVLAFTMIGNSSQACLKHLNCSTLRSFRRGSLDSDEESGKHLRWRALFSGEQRRQSFMVAHTSIQGK